MAIPKSEISLIIDSTDFSCYLDGWQGSEFTPKGPVFRRNEGHNIRPGPYQEPARASKPEVEVIDLGKDSIKCIKIVN
jgi:hypothetical protein